MKKNVLYIFLRELKTRRNLIFLLGLKNTIKLAWVKSKIAKEIAKEKSWKLWEQKHEIILSYLNSSIAKFRNTEYCACKGVKYDVFLPHPAASAAAGYRAADSADYHRHQLVLLRGLAGTVCGLHPGRGCGGF